MKTVLFIPVLFLAIACARTSAAQILESTEGRVEVGPDYISYALPEKTVTVPRDLLQVIPPCCNSFSPVDDLQILLWSAEKEGKVIPEWTPAAEDTVLTLLNSALSAATSIKAELNATRAELAAAQDTITTNRETILLLQSAVASKDVQLASLAAELDEARRDTEAFRRVVDQVARQILATLQEE